MKLRQVTGKIILAVPLTRDKIKMSGQMQELNKCRKEIAGIKN